MVTSYGLVYVCWAAIAFICKQYAVHATYHIEHDISFLRHKLCGMLRFEPSIGGKETHEVEQTLHYLEVSNLSRKMISNGFKIEIVGGLVFTLAMMYAESMPYSLEYLIGLAILQLPLIVVLLNQIGLRMKAVKFKHEGV